MAFDCIKMIIIICLFNVMAKVYSSYNNDWQNHHTDKNFNGPGKYAIPSLRFVIVLFSHGNKTPEFSYKTDLHINYFREGKGELAKKGKQNMYRKGQMLRQQYNGFLSELYKSSEILTYSTKIGRSIMSAQMVLAGMYPPKGYQNWSNTVWQPIPVYHNSPDHGFIPEGICDSYDIIRQTTIINNNTNPRDTNELLETLSNNCEEEITRENVRLLYDLFSCQIFAGLRLPDWMSQERFNNMKNIFMSEEILRKFYTNLKIQKLTIGPLLNKIALNMMSYGALTNKNTLNKMHIYSGHNDSISSVIAYLSNKQFELPHPGASLHIHLYHKIIQGYFIKLFYYKSWDTEDGEEILITTCGVPCKRSNFVKIIKRTFTLNWNSECLLV